MSSAKAENQHGIFPNPRDLSDTDLWKIMVELTFDGTIRLPEVN